ncbi:MAG: Rdx family protein [Deltaproteobacteria bacterium]|nr:Rdx family protein [Deltaproteobacteria bacterium]
MADELSNGLGIQSELVASSGGVFEVEIGGKLVFSKKKLGRFPDPGEVANLIKKSE